MTCLVHARTLGWGLAVLAGCIIGTAAARAQSPLSPQYSDVYVAGEGGYQAYREGRSWTVARVIHEGPAAYSSLVILWNRSIGLLFERGERSPYERITFARFTLEWLSEGKDR